MSTSNNLTIDHLDGTLVLARLPTSTTNSNRHKKMANNPNDSQTVLVDDADVHPDVIERTLSDVRLSEWIAVLILCYVNLINYMDRFTLAGMLTEIQDHYHITNDKGGLLQTAFILSYMVFGPLFGYLGDRYSRRLLMASGVFLWSLTTLLGSFMDNYWLFLMFRAFVGIGEASYSTIAPTIISDLFVGNIRSKMLALFYFAIPVGSGLGYIVGSEMAKAFGAWQWGLRVTPLLGGIAVILMLFVLREPQRGQSECHGTMESTTWFEDIRDIVKNRSFMLSTAGFTCVTFVAGALAWWGPKFIINGIKLQGNPSDSDTDNTSFVFGAIMMMAGIVGVTIGSYLSQKMKTRWPRTDPYLCAIGMCVSAPFIAGAIYTTTYNTIMAYILLFIGAVALDLNWPITSDMLLYVIVPIRRSTAEGFQLLISHAFGDAGSPYLIGVLSELYFKSLSNKTDIPADDLVINFKSLQYALLTTCFVEILGGAFFFINAFYIVDDKQKVERAVHDATNDDIIDCGTNDTTNNVIVTS